MVPRPQRIVNEICCLPLTVTRQRSGTLSGETVTSPFATPSSRSAARAIRSRSSRVNLLAILQQAQRGVNADPALCPRRAPPDFGLTNIAINLPHIVIVAVALAVLWRARPSNAFGRFGRGQLVARRLGVVAASGSQSSLPL